MNTHIERLELRMGRIMFKFDTDYPAVEISTFVDFPLTSRLTVWLTNKSYIMEMMDKSHGFWI
jgi:hypothetical protein